MLSGTLPITRNISRIPSRCASLVLASTLVAELAAATGVIVKDGGSSTGVCKLETRPRSVVTASSGTSAAQPVPVVSSTALDSAGGAQPSSGMDE